MFLVHPMLMGRGKVPPLELVSAEEHFGNTPVEFVVNNLQTGDFICLLRYGEVFGPVTGAGLSFTVSELAGSTTGAAWAQWTGAPGSANLTAEGTPLVCVFVVRGGASVSGGNAMSGTATQLSENSTLSSATKNYLSCAMAAIPWPSVAPHLTASIPFGDPSVFTLDQELPPGFLYATQTGDLQVRTAELVIDETAGSPLLNWAIAQSTAGSIDIARLTIHGMA